MRRPLMVAALGAALALAGSALTGCYLDRPAPLSPVPSYCETDTECEALEPILVGVGCGPAGHTLVAREEDEFGVTCRAIDLHWVRPLNEYGR